MEDPRANETAYHINIQKRMNCLNLKSWRCHLKTTVHTTLVATCSKCQEGGF
ncbi:hypothetical protein CHS0354_036223, partial [Potamilus streckersoni]